MLGTAFHRFLLPDDRSLYKSMVFGELGSRRGRGQCHKSWKQTPETSIQVQICSIVEQQVGCCCCCCFVALGFCFDLYSLWTNRESAEANWSSQPSHWHYEEMPGSQHLRGLSIQLEEAATTMFTSFLGSSILCHSVCQWT